MATILVVDDSSTVRKLITYILKRENYETLEATDGIEALEKLALNNVDLIIADLNMPKMDGLELIRIIRGSPSYEKVPIVMLTTETDETEKREALEIGANIYLMKPVPPSMLLNKIENLLSKTRPSMEEK